MVSIRWNTGGSGYNRGWQDYSSKSEYGKNLSEEEKVATAKKLVGEGYDPTRVRVGKGSLHNFFKGVNESPFHKGKYDEYLANAQSKAVSQNYDRAVQRNLFKGVKFGEEERQEQVNKTGLDDIKNLSKWYKRENALTGEQDWTRVRDREEEGNFYRKYKKEIIMGGAGVLGFAVGGPAGAVAAANLAGTLRDAYVGYKERKKYKKAKEQFERQQRQEERDRLAEIEAKKGSVYRGAGEGVIEFKTKDKTNLKKGTYVKEE